MPKILIIVPAYNEEKSIVKTIKGLDKYNKKAKYKVDYLVINDESKDDTLNVLIKNKIPHLNLVFNLGIGGAVQTGYKYAKENNYDIAIQFDGDGQHDASYLNRLINPLINEKFDLIIGSRFIERNSSDFKSSFSRRIGIKVISFFIKIFTGKEVKDVTSGFRAANKRTLTFFANCYPKEYPEPESLVRILKYGYKVKEVPVSMNKREEGKSSIFGFKSISYMILVILAIMINSKRRND